MDNNRNKITFNPIGIIHTEHTKAEDTPIQPVFAKGCRGRAEVFPEYEQGLQDVDGFSHLILIYHFHEASPASLLVKPFLDSEHRGVFATRHPGRPNPIGLSVVHLVGREGVTLFLEDVDILDETPLLDIKPFFPPHELPEKTHCGWMEKIDFNVAQSLGRRGYRGGDTSENGV